VTDFLQQVVNGLSVGAVYALIAVGFSLVYGVLNLVNFAHGDVLMAGSYVAILLYTVARWPLVLAALAGIAAGAVLSVLVEVLTARPVRSAPRLVPMITTLGAALIIRSIVEAGAGSSTRPFHTPLSGRSFHVAGLRIQWISIVTIVVAVVAVAAFGAYLKYAKSGYGIRAAAQDLDTSALMGIPINRTVVTMFAVGGALGVVGGLLYAAQIQAAYLSFGFAILLKGFIAAILGGIGNLTGALVGGLVLGVVESLAGPYLSSAYPDAIAFGLLIAVLLLRPNGLLGARVQGRV
jgi:branched-chain amino acid transport system permease protein